MKKIIFSIVFAFSLLLVSAQSDITDVKWKTHEGENYSLEYPEDWELKLRQDGEETPYDFFLFSPQNGDDSQFMVNINLIAIPVPNGEELPLDGMIEEVKAEIKKSIQNVDFESVSTVKLSGKEGMQLVYTGSVEDRNVRFIQYYVAVSEHIYIFTLTQLNEEIRPLEKIGTRVIESFRAR